MLDQPLVTGHRAQTTSPVSLNTRSGSAGPSCVPAQAHDTPHLTPPRTQTSSVSIQTASPSVAQDPATKNPTGNLRYRSGQISEPEDNLAKRELPVPKRRRLDDPGSYLRLVLNPAEEVEQQRLSVQESTTTTHRKNDMQPSFPVTLVNAEVRDESPNAPGVHVHPPAPAPSRAHREDEQIFLRHSVRITPSVCLTYETTMWK